MQLWGGRVIVMGRPAAAPQLLFMKAAAAEAHVMPSDTVTSARQFGYCFVSPHPIRES